VKFRRTLRQDATRIWSAAVRAVEPEAAIRRAVKRDGAALRIGRTSLDLSRARKIWVIGAGKAAAPMGRAVEKILGGRLSGGLLVTKYGHALPLRKLEVLEAAHPLPDANGLAAAERIRSLARDGIGPDDLVLCLLSGGASALLVSPAGDVTLEDKLECTRLLLRAGAGIYEMNAVRKHLSDLKGGGLARLLAPARVAALVLSDVVGDDLATIASGPLAPDPTTYGECLEICRRLGILDRVPRAVRRRFERGAAGQIGETPKAGDAVFRGVVSRIVGSNAQACTAAAQAARRLGYHACVLTSRLEGDTGEAARFHMNVAAEIAAEGRPLRRPACVLSGGETTVRVTGSGKGGRNQKFTLHCVRALAAMPAPCLVASLGTDGTDGPTDAAGGIATQTTLARAMAAGLDAHAALRNNDSYPLLAALNDLILTGPTQTNVNDLMLVVVR